MIKTVKYANLTERAEKVTSLESQGFRMLHDDFDDPNWKGGDPIVGTMTFTDEPELVIIPQPSRDLASEIDQIKADIQTLKTKVGIKGE